MYDEDGLDIYIEGLNMGNEEMVRPDNGVAFGMRLEWQMSVIQLCKHNLNKSIGLINNSIICPVL